MDFTDYLQRILDHMSGQPSRNAFYIAGSWHTYGELASLVAGIQVLLDGTGTDGEHVGVYVQDDIRTYASILAAWFSGKGFTPVNPLFPAGRNRRIMEQLGLKTVLHSGGYTGSPEPDGVSFVSTGDVRPQVGRTPELADFSRDRDAYVLFTSGSTGEPKGVRISFQNVHAFVRDFINYPLYDFNREDRFLQIYDLSFDASVHCYTVPLVVGACVFTVPPGAIKYLAAYKLMQEMELTFVKMPPSTLSYLRPYFSKVRLPRLKYCLLGGEAFPADLVEEFAPCIPHALIQNVYGPTEVTVNCLIYDWRIPGEKGRKKQMNGTGSIGRGFGTNATLVAGASGEPASPGTEGELLVAGEQVSPGYWKNEELNNRSFMIREEGGKPLRYYRTGDWALEDEEGDLMFLGRKDGQVQVRGYRVELGEIEHLARTFLDGVNVMALGLRKGSGDVRICLAVESAEFSRDGLRDHLAAHLPPYMVPESIVSIPEFPRQVSGKTDRKKIIDMVGS